jgi:serine phosphatase RsbU (regulator of sigma subunit)
VADILESGNDTAKLPDIYSKIALNYHEEGIYEKEGEYYLMALSLIPSTMPDKKAGYIEKIGVANFMEGKYDSAIIYFEDLLALLEQTGMDDTNVINWLVQSHNRVKQYEQALSYNEILFKRYQSQHNYILMSTLKNNIAYNLTLLKKYDDAALAYQEAIEYGETAGISKKEIALLMTNAGVCHQNMRENDEAKKYFRMAITNLQLAGMHAEKSRIENILALIYFNEEDLYNAAYFSKNSIESAKMANNPEKLVEAYLTYSRVLRAGNDPIQALEFYEKYLAIRDSIQVENKLKEQDLAKRKFELEKSEKDLKLKLKEEQVKELAIKQLTLQLEKEEQEKELLKRENDLQLLEKERLRQSLVIAQQQHAAEQQERENQILEQEKRITDLKLEQEVRRQKEQEQEIRILETQQQLDQMELERQKSTKKALSLIIVLVVLVAMVILGSLILTRKKNLLLASQKREIEQKNTDLEQKNEEIIAQRDEIEAQRDLLFDQKQAIEQYNLEIKESIEYARRIQTSTLPDLSLLNSVIEDHFILFRPRDIVSGDFFWTAMVENSTVLTVSDCTGHGVPGAFMSMLGMSILKEIVQKEYITHPGVILRKLRKEIVNALGQKGVSGEQRDGMDLALITIYHESRKLEFAGAYNSLYMVRNKNLAKPAIQNISVFDPEDHAEHVLYEIRADKMPVAYYERMDKFTTHEIDLMKGDILYLFTDGYADQFGGPAGKKFMYKPFKKLLFRHAHLPMDQQKQVLHDTLEKWMGNLAQVDDICVMGIKI